MIKRRLRKKRHLGEYRETGFNVLARYPKTPADPKEPPPPEWIERSDALLDEFIRFVESRNLGIGGNPEAHGAFVARLCRRRRCLKCNRTYGRDRTLGPVTDADREAVVEWFRAHGAVAAAGPIIDANYFTDAEFDAMPPLPEI